MQKKVVAVMAVVLLMSLSACGLLQEPAQPSATLEAIPLELTTEADDAEAEEGVEATSVPVPDTPAPEPTAEPTAQPAEAEEPTEMPAEESAGELRIYSITTGESQVIFELDEDLRGERTTVVGVTDQVAGEIAVNLSDLSTAQIGTIQINARTLATDNNFRNRAIQNEILDTGAFEFITFTPSAVNGLPASVAVGEEVSFTIQGDLTIRDITQPATFEVRASATSENQLTGTATATVLRENYDLQIPEVPNVANVENEVLLTINFVANAA